MSHPSTAPRRRPRTGSIAVVVVTALLSSATLLGPARVDASAPSQAADVVEIAAVQGTGSASPLAGATVTVEGVVTASFPTGGFRGFYLQTAGSGGEQDATPGASDAVFVYTPALAVGDYPEVGASRRVTGAVSEYQGLTEITASGGSITPIPDLEPITPRAVIPGTDCELPGDRCLTDAALEAAREAHEGELFLPRGPVTVTDSYDGSAFQAGASPSSAMYGEIGLAAQSEIPLITPTEVIDAQDRPGIAARTAYNDAHRIVLDDGSSTNYATAAGSALPYPWLTPDHTVRVGAAVTFSDPVVLDFRFGWKLQPQGQVVGVPRGISFAQDRAAAPADVGGDVALGTFNVLNYFTTLGVDQDGACTAYNDRTGAPITVRSCPDGGPRGAWDAANLARQQAKIVASINALGADIVSLEEIENSAVVDRDDRDEAVAALVAALNENAGRERWRFAPSPAEVPANEDVIRTAFIYDPSAVRLVGESQILGGEAAFDNARQPLAQVFAPQGATGLDDAFLVIVNHFKSKGSGTPDPDGQGNANADRVAQAEALVRFADEVARDRGVGPVFLTGDFNAYSAEDPVQAIEAAGYTNLEPTTDPHERSYSFDGAVGSLDHVFANEAAAALVSDVDIWTTNAYEPVFYEYSRFDANITRLYDASPFRASDHNPEIVGIDLPGAGSEEPQEPSPPRFETTVQPDPVRWLRPVRLRIAVTTEGGRPASGTVVVHDRLLALRARLVDGVAQVTLPGYLVPGAKQVRIRYSGDDEVAAGEHSLRFRVLL
ncbi:ExeM/NucH family extracellular endonuclease [Nocardioides sp. R-C-SC26]|uniref:ExeM/NucH family extracellular endonuclease n=1 Tax=Nocardioides sp. R-C-SC26 TaxID=2870414 RepID=UPI001E516795|nr:ExeM/NucH family extracellular endonuclease [Nocardioides sp. R-C-SC26]